MKAVFFDLDGTLVESIPGLTDALNLTLKDLGQAPIHQEIVRTFVGNGLWMLLRRALPVKEFSDNQITDLQTSFQKHYKGTWRPGTTAFTGIKSLLTELSQDGITLGVLSNKPHRFTVEITEDLFGRKLVPYIHGQKEGVAKKPDPAPLIQLCDEAQVTTADCIYVGDSTVDLECAANAAIKAIGVTWGYHNALELGKFNQPLADTVAELRSILFANAA